MVEQRCAGGRQFAHSAARSRWWTFFSVRWRRLASGRFERRREKTGKQKSFSQRRSLGGKLRSGEAWILREHGRAQRRDNFVNDLML